MRIDAFSVWTWLFATVAGWAALVCMLALAGMGRSVQLLRDDSQLIRQKLPSLPASAAEHFGPFTRYGEIAARPVFSEDRKPHPFLLVSGENTSVESDVRLTGVLITPKFKMATLTNEQNQSLRIRLGGDAVNGWRLISLQPRSATIEGAGGTRTLELQPFNGQANKNANNPPENNVPTMVEHPVASPSSEAASAALVKPSTSAVSQSDRVPGGQQPAAVTGPQAPEKPIDAQIRAIRERIEARRRQLQQQQEQQK
ncbi:general secretion pathway protein GspN [Xylella fastidiosa subsp. multiplex]|uniref:hypothetical protein n=1 Tax=Xylella fastidiosa TaxID=2371 RepID=UPI0004DD1975|nr:hypothetical protein [Xylella fastidiosa]KFA41037.1 general secretion pathway protein N [Xylella fastidiosa]MDD0910066.1 general secretion pathway protein GspN [Xylella fastidiosa subsp. multiplex]MDS9989556.1 hypothetical protein [Xylella fastidiosa]UIT48585.1 general secretion pathway protein GspN [Xylella fastidiosa subsp. multiplex]